MKLVPHCDQSRSVYMFEDNSNSLHQQAVKHMIALDKIENDVKEAVKAAWSPIFSVTTTGALIKAWPEIEPFIPETNKDRSLPAINKDELNTMFELPKEENAA